MGSKLLPVGRRTMPLLLVASLLLGLLLATVSASPHPSPELQRYKRLTTFGKAPEKQNSPGHRGKECRTERECPVEHSGCKEDTDGKRRCICDDGAYPVRGVCQHIRGLRAEENCLDGQKRGYVPKGNGQTKEKAVKLRDPCSYSSECIAGAECKINPNATTPAMQRTKVCLCTEDTIEEDNECSGSTCLQTSNWIFLIIGLSSIVAFHH